MFILFCALLGGCSSSSATKTPPDAGKTGGGFDATVSNGGDAEAGVDAGPCPTVRNVSFGGAGCPSCVASHCCTTASACFGSSQCALLATCLADCVVEGDSAVGSCSNICNGTYDAQAPYAAMQMCITSSCTNEAEGGAPCVP
jgi:hypothetical protein